MEDMKEANGFRPVGTIDEAMAAIHDMREFAGASVVVTPRELGELPIDPTGAVAIDNEVYNVGDTNKTSGLRRHVRAITGVAASAIALGTSIGVSFGNADSAAASPVNSINYEILGDEARPISEAKDETATTPTEIAITARESEQVAEDSTATLQTKVLEKIGMTAEQVTFVDLDKKVEGPIEASERSMNLGKTKELGDFTVSDSIEVSRHVLRGEYGNDRAWNVIDAMVRDGFAAEQIREFAETGTIKGAELVAFRLNTDSAQVKDTPYVKNGVLHFDDSRAVGANDYFLSIKLPDEAIKISRVDCGAIIQRGMPVVSVVSAPPNLPPMEFIVPNTPPTIPETTTTTIPETTTTTTTIPETTTTTTTIPETTTTTYKPKEEDDNTPGGVGGQNGGSGTTESGPTGPGEGPASDEGINDNGTQGDEEIPTSTPSTSMVPTTAAPNTSQPPATTSPDNGTNKPPVGGGGIGNDNKGNTDPSLLGASDIGALLLAMGLYGARVRRGMSVEELVELKKKNKGL